MKKKLIILLGAGCLTLCSNSAFAVFSVALTPSNHNGYSVSCFGGIDGAINITVSGGTSPYTYRWSTGATTQNVSGLASGYYQVSVTDANSATCSGNVTLTQPTILTLSISASLYTPQSTNISCYNCCNGYINISVGGGVTAYSYVWNSGHTTGNITNLCKNTYKITVTDANGCSIDHLQVMTEPDKDTWTQTGNSGSNPPTQFIGTTDNKDLVFKTNNSEALRIKANGKVKFHSLIDTLSYSPVIVDSSGQLRSVNANDDNLDAAIYNATSWLLGGNSLPAVPAENNYLGTKNNKSLIFKTYTNNLSTGGERMRITADGDVGIGTSSPSQKFEVSHSDPLHIIQGIAINKINDGTSSKHSEIRFNYNGNQKWAIGNDLNNNGDQNFFIWDHVTGGGRTRLFIDPSGRTFIGFNTLPSTTSSLYKLFVDGGIVSRDVKVQATNWPDYVFADHYQPLSLFELEQFIKQNKHLPGIPSAKEIEKNEGFELGDMQAKLLKKIEEQSLYIIDLQKQMDKLNAKMEKISKK